jgi:ankyrin repeat protein
MTEIEINKSARKAIKDGNLEDFVALWEAYSSLKNATTPFGTWLHVAADAGQLPIVKWLAEKGIDVNCRAGISGGNALNEAAMENHADVAHYLLSVGAEMDVSGPERNPLFSAIQEGSLEIVKMFLQAGIDASVRYSGPHMNNMGAYEFAVEQGQQEIAAYIRDWLKKHGS